MTPMSHQTVHVETWSTPQGHVHVVDCSLCGPVGTCHDCTALEAAQNHMNAHPGQTLETPTP